MRNPRVAWVLTQISEWQDAGIISPYQAEAIRSRYAPSGVMGSRRGMHALIWSVMGVGGVALSMVLAIAHWWVSFPLLVRLIIACFPVMMSWLVAVGVLKNWRFFSGVPTQWVAPLNTVCGFISTVVAANLYGGLVGWEALGVTAIVLSAPLLIRFPSQWWVLCSALALNGLVWGADSIVLRAIIGLTAVVISLPVSTAWGRPTQDWINPFIAWTLALAINASVVGVSESLHPTAFMLLPLTVWALILGLSRWLPPLWILRRPMVLLAAAGFFTSLFLGGSNGIWNEWVGVSVVETSSFVIILGAALGLSIAAFGVTKAARFRWALLMPSVVGLIGMIVHRFLPEWVFPTLFSTMAVAGAIAAIRFGVTSANRGWINSGVIALVLVSLEKSMSSQWPIGIRIAFLAIAGLGLLAVGFYFNSKVVKR